MTLQRRLQVLIVAVTLVLGVVVTGMGVTLSHFQRDANHRDRLASAMPDLGRLAEQPFDLGAAARFKHVREVFATERAVGPAVAAAGDALDAARVPGAAPETMATARAAMHVLVEAAAKAVDRALVQGKRTRRDFIVAVGIATGAAAFLLFLGSLLLRRWVVVPIGRLHTDIDAVGEGDLYHPITPTGARDLVELAAAAERMRTRILWQRDAVERAGEAVDQDAPAVAALRELLAPTASVSPAGLDVAATLLPAEGVLAGDWYDLVALDNLLFVSIGDVCGHGASTGISAVRSKFALLDAMHLGLDPDVALHLAERRFDDSSAFVTCTVVEVDPDTGTGRYANAGHPPGMVVTARGAARTLDPTGPLIGPFPAEWETRAFTLAAGETLVLYSDGVTEARNARGDELGTDAIVRAVAATPGGSANATMEALISELFQHAPDGFDDDITVVVVRRVAP